MNTLAVITVHNPSDNLIHVAEELISACISQIIIVDNGSGRAGREVLGTLSTYPGCTVLSLPHPLPGNEAITEAFAFYDQMLCGDRPADRLYIASADDERSLEYMLERVAGDEAVNASAAAPVRLRVRDEAVLAWRNTAKSLREASASVRRKLCFLYRQRRMEAVRWV